MAAGTLSTAGQHDWLKLSLNANQGYLFTVTGLDQYATLLIGAAGTLDDSLLGTVSALPGGTAGTSQIFYEPSATGTYFIDVSDSANTASYTVSGTAVSTDYTDNANTSGTVTIGGAATHGTLSTAGQHDWLKLSLTANQGYVFTVTGLDQYATLLIGAAGTLDDSLLGTVSALPGGTAGTSQIFYEPSATGTYFIDVSDSANTASYTVSGTAVSTDYTDNANTSGTVTIGGAATHGTLSTAGQHDWLKLSLTSNQGYVFTVTGLDQYATLLIGAAGTLDDSLLGTVSALPGGTAGTSQIFYEPSATGTYFIDVSDYANTASYTVSGTAVSTDYTDNANTSGTVTIGGAATHGTLSTAGQHDWLKLSLTSNQGYVFTVTGLDQYATLLIGAAGTLDDSLLGTVSSLPGGTAGTSQIFYEPSATGTYFIDVSDYANTTSYTVSGTAVSTDYSDNANTSGTVTIGGAATHGTLSTAGQHDWLKLSLNANQGYLFTVTGLDQYATLLIGAAGTLDDSLLGTVSALPGGTAGTSQIFYEPSATGTYFIDISDYSNTASYSVSSVAVSTDYTDNASTTGVVTACFAAGTRIATDRGDVPVEQLRETDHVRTLWHGYVPIVWLGYRTISFSRHPRPRDAWPVRVSAGAFGTAEPARDLLLSPDHAVFIDGVLIPVRYLINGRTIAQERCEAITYWHIELPRHDILYAEGLPAESYLDTGNRAAFANGGAEIQMHADFARQVWDERACAPLVLGGAELEAARSYVRMRAELLGHAITDDPNLCFMVNGRAQQPRVNGDWLVLDLPEGASSVRLVSRDFVPAELCDDSGDERLLGIAVAAITIDDAPIPLSDPSLARGWHAEEGSGRSVWRWTDGDAVLATRGRSIAFRIAMTGRYWANRPARVQVRAA